MNKPIKCPYCVNGIVQETRMSVAGYEYSCGESCDKCGGTGVLAYPIPWKPPEWLMRVGIFVCFLVFVLIIMITRKLVG